MAKTQSLPSEIETAREEIAAILRSLRDKTGLDPLHICLTYCPDYQNGGRKWDGNIRLTVGV